MNQPLLGEDFVGRGVFGVTRGGSGGERRRLRVIFVWLLFIVFSLVSAVKHHGSAADRALLIAGAAAFVATYVGLILYWRQGVAAGSRRCCSRCRWAFR